MGGQEPRKESKDSKESKKSQYATISVIGSGSCGTCKLVRSKKDGQDYVLKKIDIMRCVQGKENSLPEEPYYYTFL